MITKMNAENRSVLKCFGEIKSVCRPVAIVGAFMYYSQARQLNWNSNSRRTRQLGPLLLTWINLNPGMDK